MAPVVDNHHCLLLTNEENLQVFKLLGNRCQSLCTTVVQLFLTQAPNHSQWLKKSTGVLCFVKDNIKKNFFFRLFCLKRNAKVWEHELYINMDYIINSKIFHMFEGEEGLVAFNFANAEEANDYRIVVHQKIHAQKRRVEKRTRAISQTLPPPRTNIDYSGFKKVPDVVAKQNKRKRNITKADIGIPKDFKHISHVGWNSNSGFDIDTQDEQLKAFFRKAGISDKQLQDKKTRDYIYDFINQNGGIEVVKKSVVENNVTPPAVPPRGPTRPPHFRNAPPPPVPVKSNNIANLKSKPPADNPLRKPAPVIGSAPNVPPPPPPPPMDNFIDGGLSVPPPPPPPLTAPPSPRSEGGMSAELLNSIRNGTTLKQVEERKPIIDDARGDLLSEIRKGCKLRPVDERDVKPAPAPQTARGNDLASALAKALAKRSEVIHSEDDDDKSDDSSDLDEWDD